MTLRGRRFYSIESNRASSRDSEKLLQKKNREEGPRRNTYRSFKSSSKPAVHLHILVYLENKDRPSVDIESLHVGNLLFIEIRGDNSHSDAEHTHPSPSLQCIATSFTSTSRSFLSFFNFLCLAPGEYTFL